MSAWESIALLRMRGLREALAEVADRPGGLAADLEVERAAERAAQAAAEERAEVRRELGHVPSASRYGRGCRCPGCTECQRERMREYKRKRRVQT